MSYEEKHAKWKRKTYWLGLAFLVYLIGFLVIWLSVPNWPIWFPEWVQRFVLAGFFLLSCLYWCFEPLPPETAPEFTKKKKNRTGLIILFAAVGSLNLLRTLWELRS